MIIVDRHELVLRLFAWNADAGVYMQLVKYPVAVGMLGLATPRGPYRVTSRSDCPSYTYPDSEWVPVELRGVKLPYGDPRNPIAARWIGLADGIGIHGTFDDSSIGTRASHGCVRMHAADVIELYPHATKDSIVVIE